MPAALIFLTIDRCWIILVGIISHRKQVIFSTTAMIISICCDCIVSYSYGKDPPKSASTNCSTFGCLVNPSGYNTFIIFKMVAGGCNFTAGIIFLILWRLQKKKMSKGFFHTTMEERKKRDVSSNFLINPLHVNRICKNICFYNNLITYVLEQCTCYIPCNIRLWALFLTVCDGHSNGFLHELYFDEPHRPLCFDDVLD